MSGASPDVEVMKRLKDQIATRPSTPPRDWQLEERLYLKRVKFQVFYKVAPTDRLFVRFLLPPSPVF